MRAGNSPVVLKNSTEHAKSLFIALFEFSVAISQKVFYCSENKFKDIIGNQKH